MGLDNIPSRSTGQTILDEFWNALKRVLGGDFVPRNVSGIPQANAGHLGTDAYPWKRAHVTAGYFICGMVIPFHDFNGEISPGQGWMKCNGDQVSEDNYDAIHGEGSWATYVGASPIEGKYLPDMDNKFPVGKVDTDQDGDSPITSEGRLNHTAETSAHVHPGTPHQHIWYRGKAASLSDTTYDNTGAESAITDGAVKTGSRQSIAPAPNSVSLRNFGGDDSWTNLASPATGSAGYELINIKPESHAFEYWMRII